MRYKVGFLTNIYTPYKEALLSELSKSVDLKVYYCALREPNRKWGIEFSRNYRYEILSGFSLNIGRFYLHFNYSIFYVLLRDRPDFLIIGGYSYPTVIVAAIFCKVIGIRTILWSGSTELERHKFRFLYNIVKRMVVKTFDGYVAYTSRAAEYLKHLGARDDRTVVAPVTVDVDFFIDESMKLRVYPGRDVIRQRFGYDPQDIVIIFVGQLVKRKGVDILLRAMAELQHSTPVHLLIVGDGPLRGEWEILSKQLGVDNRIHWCGHASQHKLVEFYVAADIMILPSFREPSGNVINEAMSVGLPVIISDLIGTDIVINDKTGYIFPAGNIQKLKELLEEMIDNKIKRLVMSENAVNRVAREFTISIEASKFVDILEIVDRD